MRTPASISKTRLTQQLLSALALLWFVTCSGRAADAAQFVIAWNEVQVEVRPRHGTWNVSKSIKLNLEGGAKISEEYSVKTKEGYSGSLDNKGKFREASRYSAVWRVENQSTLVRTWTKAQHTETMRVIIDGKNCSATISYNLKPGFREYMMISVKDRQPLYFTALSAQDIVCRAFDQTED